MTHLPITYLFVIETIEHIPNIRHKKRDIVTFERTLPKVIRSVSPTHYEEERTELLESTNSVRLKYEPLPISDRRKPEYEKLQRVPRESCHHGKKFIVGVEESDIDKQTIKSRGGP